MVPAFLDVTASALGQRWVGRLDAAGDNAARAMVQTGGYDDALARVLAGRGIKPEAAEGFLHPKLRDLMPDPLLLQDMQGAVTRLAEAIERRECVAIFGDYDVDGACSTALMAEYLQAMDCPCLIYIPDRIFEGYGPNAEAIETLRQDGAQLLVTVDCGTMSHEVLAGALASGLPAIVLDHHQAPEVLPPALVVNPNRQDDVSGLTYLCAAGVVHLTLVALQRELGRRGWFTGGRAQPDLMAALDMVALATVADIAALVGLNRAYVRRGLEVMAQRQRVGLAALADAARLQGPPRASHLGFALGPRINAGGRIGDAALGARLLLERDPLEAARMAGELDRLNEERRKIETATLDEAQAEAEAAQGGADLPAVIVTAADDWHPGVVGLVASRLRETFQRPAFAIAYRGATGTGSGRSVPGIDLGRTVREAVDAGLLVRGGGHAMAAGLTIKRDQLGAFRAWLERRFAGKMQQLRAEARFEIDAALAAGGLTPALAQALEAAGPFGAGNPEPVFALADHYVVDALVLKDQHVKLRLRGPDRSMVDAIAFRAYGRPLGNALLAARGARLHVAGTLMHDSWLGRARVQLRIIDCASVET
ncbi:MAG: single-stranded-DNA-specific exonuclease RecJ [Hyphomicrobiales bacterium]|nr:single-stranded-DNA-specific exonuclease RecJ [Hyphomicrobiales bacterium]